MPRGVFIRTEKGKLNQSLGLKKAYAEGRFHKKPSTLIDIKCPCSLTFKDYKGTKFCSRLCFYKYGLHHLGTYKRSAEQIEKIRQAHLGKPLSKEHKEAIRQALRGKSHPWTTGENNFNWKGGIVSKDKLERDKFKNTIQKQIFERDNYTCVLCGDKSIRGHHIELQVDHIQSWSEYVELRFKLENCRTLCMDCHYKITFGKPRPEHIKTWGHNYKRKLL